MNKGLGNKHTIHNEHLHLSWDNATPPAITVAPGDVVEFEEIDALMGQITPQSGVDDVINMDFARVNPVAGPVYVDGAEPGDALKVTLLDFAPSGWAWPAIVPGFGLLADDFPFCFRTLNIPCAVRLKMGLKKAFFFKIVHFI